MCIIGQKGLTFNLEVAIIGNGRLHIKQQLLLSSEVSTKTNNNCSKAYNTITFFSQSIINSTIKLIVIIFLLLQVL